MKQVKGRFLLFKTILAAVTLLLVCPCLGAQAGDRPASVIVAIAPSPGADAAYELVLRDALVVALTRNRMNATGIDAADDARVAAREHKADYLVLGTWSNTSENLDLAVEVWLPEGAVPLATGKASDRISLTLDSVARAALSKVLPAMQARFPADATAAAAGSAASGGTAAIAAGSSQPSGGTTGAVTGTATAIGPSDAGTAAAAGSQPRWRRVELAFGGAPLVNTGTVADYAKIGAVASLDFDIRFPVGKSALAPGLFVGGSWFRATGIGVADVLVIPAGPDLHWTITADANPGVSFRVASGPAAVIAIPNWANTVWKISPFVAGGVDVDIGLTPVLGLRLEAEYMVVFEGSMVLQGFTPRLSLRTRF
jgi:hypothetical protein